MPTISEYARAHGVSHQYISKLVKKGMPLTTFEAADQFREAHANSKPPTNPTRIARTINEQHPHVSLDALFTAETAYREELERRRILIPLAEAMGIARRGYEIILQGLKVLPQTVASLCNPADPARAITALESECPAILEDAQMVYASWSDDQAPASNSSQL